MHARIVVLSVLLVVVALVSTACLPVETLPQAAGTTEVAALEASPGEAAPEESSPVENLPPTPAPVPSPTSAAAVAEDEFKPAPAVTEVVEAPVVPAPAVTEAAPQAPADASPVLATYSDQMAGFQIDFPAGWSVIDVPDDQKRQSPAYSITLTSWQPEQFGTQGIPEGGSKVDIGVTRDAAETPAQAIEARAAQLAAADPNGRFESEEPWELENGLAAVRWTIRTSQGQIVHELVTAIGGHRIVISGLGSPVDFDAIAMTLRAIPSDTVAIRSATPAPARGQVGGADAPAAPGATYVVVAGDTLAKIAAAFGTTVRALLDANPQITDPDRIYIGQRLTIPPAGAQPLPVPPAVTRVNIYLISLEDGNVGCGDGVVAVSREMPWTPAVLTAALNQLLGLRDQYYGQSGLYNALYQSELEIARISRLGSAWTVELRGSLVLGGVCDGPRVEAQLEQTALQFSTVSSVRYLINGQPLASLISGQ